MKVIFRGDPIELARGEGLSRTVLDLWGVNFRMGVATDVSHLDEKQQAKLRTNAHFEVVAEEAPPAPVVEAPVNSEAPEADEVAEAADEPERAAAPTKAQRKGKA